MFWTFLLSNWRVVAIATLFISNILAFDLWRNEANAFAKFKADTVAIGEAQEKHTATVVAEQKQITEETANGWKAALDYTRSYYGKRLLPQSGSGKLPGVPSTSGSIDDLPTDAVPLAGQCAETTLQLITLQDWVKKQESAK